MPGILKSSHFFQEEAGAAPSKALVLGLECRGAGQRGCRWFGGFPCDTKGKSMFGQGEVQNHAGRLHSEI